MLVIAFNVRFGASKSEAQYAYCGINLDALTPLQLSTLHNSYGSHLP
jgi:hypothetical protein